MNTILDPHHADLFREFFGIVQRSVHQIAKDKGWWENEDANALREFADQSISDGHQKLYEIADKLENRNTGEMLALMHSELSEALEGERHGNPPSDHIPEFSAVEEELADVVIRIMNMSERRGYRTAQAIVAKIKFNHGREHKHGGKKF